MVRAVHKARDNDNVNGISEELKINRDIRKRNYKRGAEILRQSHSEDIKRRRNKLKAELLPLGKSLVLLLYKLGVIVNKADHRICHAKAKSKSNGHETGIIRGSTENTEAFKHEPYKHNEEGCHYKANSAHRGCSLL